MSINQKETVKQLYFKQNKLTKEVVSMEAIKYISNGYKKQFIEDILSGMEGFLDNKQLSELNKSLYHNTVNLDFADNPKNHDLNYQKTNQILIEEFIKNKKIHGLF